jgi:SAM-dependent methyltransferase
MTGTKPAADTRFGSSNTADPTANVCEDCTGNAFRTRDVFDFSNRYCPRSEGIFAVYTPITKDRPSTDSGLGLDNVELVHGDIAHLDRAAVGQFDFIICHGVYSWVPHEVQEAILAACGQLLSPSGVAYVGYNTYPGWKAKEIVRDAMLLSVGDSTTIDEKVRRARSMVDFLYKVAQPDSVLARALNDYQLMAGTTGDYYLLHEELEIFNAPCYFRDFVDRARAHGLDYLAEALPEYTFARNYGPTVVDHLLDYADRPSNTARAAP